MPIPISWILGGVGALVLSGAVAYGVHRVDNHFDEYARLQKAETELTTQRDAFKMATEGLVEEMRLDREEHVATVARLSARADTEHASAVATRNALVRLQNAPGRNEVMPPVLRSAFDIVRERRQLATTGARAGAPRDLSNPGAAPPLPTTP